MCAISVMLMPACADVVCGTWNMQWFPSGRAEHRASEEAESLAMKSGAETLSVSIGKVTTSTNENLVVFFQEMRSMAVCSNLVSAIAWPGLELKIASAFRSYDNRLEWQQCAIASNMPTLDAYWSRWRRNKKITPPRGYAFALLDGGADGVIACFCLHLKSNYGAGGNAELAEKNRLKREACAAQLIELCKKIKTRDGRKITKIIIAGDFNTDRHSGKFGKEATITMLLENGFADCHEGLPIEQRTTYSGRTKNSRSTLDYILHRGFKEQSTPVITDGGIVSDHNTLFVRLK